MKREGKAGSQDPAGGMAGTQDRGSHPIADGEERMQLAHVRQETNRRKGPKIVLQQTRSKSLGKHGTLGAVGN